MSVTKISDLPAVNTVSDGDGVPLFSLSAGDTRRAPMSVIKTYIAAGLAVGDGKVVQYASPSASPFTTVITNSSTPVWLVLTPTGTMAVGTITLPAKGTSVANQEVLVNTTQAVTSLTVGGNGSNVVGAPTTLAANASFRMRYDALNDTWYKVG